MDLLENIEAGSDAAALPFRMPVQWVCRPNADFRGYCGTIDSGWVRVGDTVVVPSSGLTSTVRRIVTFDGDLKEAAAGQAVNLVLVDEIDISRGDMLVVAAGMIDHPLRRATNVHRQHETVDKAARAAIKGQKLCVLWFTGLSGSGKSTLANLVERKLHAMGRHTVILDGDNIRHGLTRDLGFTDADRVENIRRIAEVAKLFVEAGTIALVAFILPFRSDRQMARELLGEGEFLEIFVDTPLDVCRTRDVKGLYAKAFKGEIPNFTGVQSPYEAPEAPELRIDGSTTPPENAADRIVALLEDRDFQLP